MSVVTHPETPQLALDEPGSDERALGSRVSHRQLPTSTTVLNLEPCSDKNPNSTANLNPKATRKVLDPNRNIVLTHNRDASPPPPLAVNGKFSTSGRGFSECRLKSIAFMCNHLAF